MRSRTASPALAEGPFPSESQEQLFPCGSRPLGFPEDPPESTLQRYLRDSAAGRGGHQYDTHF